MTKNPKSIKSILSEPFSVNGIDALLADNIDDEVKSVIINHGRLLFTGTPYGKRINKVSERKKQIKHQYELGKISILLNNFGSMLNKQRKIIKELLNYHIINGSYLGLSTRVVSLRATEISNIRSNSGGPGDYRYIFTTKGKFEGVVIHRSKRYCWKK